MLFLFKHKLFSSACMLLPCNETLLELLAYCYGNVEQDCDALSVTLAER